MIHTSYTVGITTGEYKALQSVMVDQNEWITNALQNRARIATLEIQTLYTNYKIVLLYLPLFYQIYDNQAYPHSSYSLLVTMVALL